MTSETSENTIFARFYFTLFLFFLSKSHHFIPSPRNGEISQHFFTLISHIILVRSGRGSRGEAVLHISYNDGACGEKWGEILKLPKAIVDQEIHRALEYKFQSFKPIPKPLSTIYQYWSEGAW